MREKKFLPVIKAMIRHWFNTPEDSTVHRIVVAQQQTIDYQKNTIDEQEKTIQIQKQAIDSLVHTVDNLQSLVKITTEAFDKLEQSIKNKHGDTDTKLRIKN